MKRLLCLGALALGATLAVDPALSQPSSPDPAVERLFREAIEVEVINIDVYVSDRQGNPVPGLTKDDFLLLVDGRSAPISNFYAVSSGVATPEPAPAPEPETEPERAAPPLAEPPVAPAEVSPPPPAETPPDQRLHLVVYIDNYNLTPFNRNRVMGELRQFLLDQLGPQDEVMLASYDRSLHLRHPFTADHLQVASALGELETLSAHRVHRDRERRDLFALVLDTEFEDPRVGRRRLDETDHGYYESVALNQLQSYAESVRNDMHFTIDALASIVDNLAGSPGRKAVVYVSDGIPMIAGEDIFYFINQLYEGSFSLTKMTEFDLSRRFQELAAKANANRVTFYTIDARGLTVLTQGTVDPAVEGFAGQQAFIDSIWVSNLQHPLQTMAEETGGRAILNANRITPDLLKVASDFENYYSLGYSPATPGDGRYHRVEVKLKRPAKGMQVRHRSGYRSKSLQARMIDGTLSALNLDLQANHLGASFFFGPPKPRSDGYFDTPTYVRVPFDRLTLIEHEGAYRGRLRLWMAAKDEQDRATEAHEFPIDIQIPSDRIAETEGKSYTVGPLELMMEAGYHDLAVGVRDELGGQHAFLRRGIDVRAQ